MVCSRVTAISEMLAYISGCLVWNTARHAVLLLGLSAIGLVGIYGVCKVVIESVLQDHDDVIYEAIESWSHTSFAVVCISHFGSVRLYSRLHRVHHC